MVNNEGRATQLVFTVVANNYLSYARTLMQSVRQHSPNVKRVVFLCDRQSSEYQTLYDSMQGEFELIPIEQIDIPDFPNMALAYSLIELCTAIKPFCFQYLFNMAYQDVIYLDPDVKTYASLNKVFDLLESSNIVLTPHLTNSIQDAMRPTEIDILRAGVYNLGFIAVNSSSESRRFINWWSQRLKHHCLAEPDKGLYVDQRWIDLVPCMFHGVHISKDPGLNIAYWNLSDREISSSDSSLQCNGERLIFIHYSGINPKTGEFSRHQNRHSLNKLPKTIKDLTLEYIDQLRGNGANENQAAYAFELFHNGETISDIVRQVFRESKEAFKPTIISQDDPTLLLRLTKLLNRPMQHPVSGEPVPLISRGLYYIYRSRPDLQIRFPDLFNADTEAFVRWFLIAQNSNHYLPQGCVLHCQQELAKLSQSSGDRPSNLIYWYHKTPLLRRLVLRFTTEKGRQRLLSWLSKTHRH